MGNTLYSNLINSSDPKFANLKRRCNEFIDEASKNSPTKVICYDQVIKEFLATEAMKFAVINTILFSNQSLDNLNIFFRELTNNNNRKRTNREMLVHVVEFFVKLTTSLSFEFGFAHPFFDWMDYNPINNPDVEPNAQLANAMIGRGASMWALIGLTFTAFATTKMIKSMYYDPHINNIDLSSERLRTIISNDEKLQALIAEYERSGLNDIPFEAFLDLMKKEKSELNRIEFDKVLKALKAAIEPMLFAEHDTFMAFSELILRGDKKVQQLVNGLEDIVCVCDVTTYNLMKRYKEAGFLPSIDERFDALMIEKYEAVFFRLDNYDEIMKFYKVSNYTPTSSSHQQSVPNIRKRDIALGFFVACASVVSCSSAPAQIVAEIHHRSQVHELNLMRRGQK